MAKKLSWEIFDFDDVMLVPGECSLTSRSLADTSVQFGPKRFDLPVVPANMSTIVDEDLAVWLAENDLFYSMHRFDVDAEELTRRMHGRGLYSSVSVGVQEADHRMVSEWSYDAAPEYVTIDIAHGDATPVFKMVSHIKEHFPDTFVIAGNVATPDAVRRLEDAGADAAKVGVAPGSACLTGPQTGFGTRGWQLSAVEWCAEAAKSIKIVADGGIRKNGDIAKALAFGADMVMVGGMLAGHDQNPGEIFEDDEGQRFKVFFGSASEHQKGEKKHVEGLKMNIPYRGDIEETFRDIKESLQSSVSYSGGSSIGDLMHSTYVILK